MIVAQAKPFEVVRNGLGGARRVLVAACAECVTVCGTGGEREAELLAFALRLAARREGRTPSVTTTVIQRQCEPEFLERAGEAVRSADAVVSLACGVGVGFLADAYPQVRVLPGLDTVFGGGTLTPGVFEERCRMCGECVLGETGGICPVTRCAKNLWNGPCGGSVEGRCEVDPQVSCAWQDIWDRLVSRGEAGSLEEITPPKDWSASGQLRRMVRLP